MILKLNLVNLLINELIQMIQITTEMRVLEEVLLGVLPRILGSLTKDVLYWLVLTIKHLNLLPPNMAGAFQKALRQMVCQSALKKVEALLSVLPLHADIALHLQSGLLVHIVMGIEMLEGTLIEIQATEIILSAHHRDVFEAHQRAAVPDTKAEEVVVGASPAVQYEAVIETMVVAEVQYAVLAQKAGDLP